MQAYILEIIVVCLGLAMLLLETFGRVEDKKSIGWLGILGLIVVLCLLFKVEIPDPKSPPEGVFQSFYVVDRFALFYKGIALVATLVVLVMSTEFLGVMKQYTARVEAGAPADSGLGEYFILPVFTCAGLMWMASANNLASIFVSLEMVTISFYVMVAYQRRKVGGLEAGVKYLVLGAFSTGFLVYGFAWLYGATGELELDRIGEALRQPGASQVAALFSFALILVALGFKIGAFPFQIWMPDVYQGAPMPTTALLSVGSKAAGFIVFLRVIQVFLESQPGIADKVALILSILAGATVVFGNLAAMPQSNFKRMFAYSSIAHAGFLLLAVAAAPESEPAPGGLSPARVVSFYLAAYTPMTLLAFAVMGIVRTRNPNSDFEMYRGLSKSSPFLAFSLLIALAALAGVPLTVGFFGKFFVFQLVIQQQQWLLAGLGIVGAGAGFYYYFKAIGLMYWNDPVGEPKTYAIGLPLKVTMVILIIGVLALGFFPTPILSLM